MRVASCYCPTLVLLGIAWIVAIFPSESYAREYHDWIGIGKGSWRKERIVSEAIDKQTGKVTETRVTETTKTLVARDKNSVTIKIVSIVDVAGKEFNSPPTEVVYYRHGQAPDETAVIAELESKTIEIANRKYSCKVRRVTIDGAETKQIVTSYYIDPDCHSVLQREIEALDQDGESKFKSTRVAIGLDMPEQVLGEIRPATHFRTVHKNHKGTTTTFSVLCDNIPGQIVSNSTKETDSQGMIVRRSTMRLVQYEIVAPVTEKRSGLGNRLRRLREQRRTSRR